MEKPTYKLVGAPCGHHGQYTFYKALRVTGQREKIFAIGDFFFVRIWQDSELVSIGELQLLWTDRASDQTLVSLRLYFLPENTPDGRNLHGEDEVLAINDKVVLRADDLLSWVCDGGGWRWGRRAVWRGACAPPPEAPPSAPLHHTRLDFTDVDKEKSAIEEDADCPGVVVFSYPRYCRYRALASRLEGIQANWLRDSLVAALGGYAAPTKNTRILYCKDTFEYPELEGHEFVCNHLAPRLKGRPRGRRRRAPTHALSPARSSDTDTDAPATPRRMSLRPPPESPEEEDDDDCYSAEDRSFLRSLKQFYKDRKETFKMGHSFKDLSLRALYSLVSSRGGYEAVSRHKLWRTLSHDQPARIRRHYERYLLPYESYERRNGASKLNGKVSAEPHTVATIEVLDSPRRDTDTPKILRTPSPKTVDSETGESKMEFISKPAEELNREFLDSLPKDEARLPQKLAVPKMMRLLDDSKALVSDLSMKVGEHVTRDRIGCLSEVARKLELGKTDSTFLKDMAASDKAQTAPVNGHTAPPAPTDLAGRPPPGRSSLRAVRVKPTRSSHGQPPGPPPSASPPSINNFGIHHPPPPTHSDDEIVEVPYKPKTPEIIDLDEYPESPQQKRKKLEKLDILKERGLEVTALPTTWSQPMAITNPIVAPAPIMLNPVVQHQIMTQAQLFQMYNMIPPNFPNGLQPPKVIQGTGIFGSTGPEKTVYGNPKDPFMPPPHILHGAPVKPKNVSVPPTPPLDILDLTCKTTLPAVEIVRLPSPSKSAAQNLTKNYSVVDGKAVVGSHLEITLVNKTPNKKPQKRSSNGKFVSAKTPTPPKDKPYCPSPSGAQKKSSIVVPHYQINRDETSPTSSTGSSHSQSNLHTSKQGSLMHMMDLQKGPLPGPFVDPYAALYSSLAGQMDQRQLAVYRDFMANQFRGYGGLLNLGVTTPTTKN